MFCLDTNIIIDIFHGDESLRERLDRYQGLIYTTPLVLAELYKGAYQSKKKEEALKLVEDFIDSIELLPFSEQACKVFGEKYIELRMEGKTPQEMDLMIASIALVHRMALVTRDKKGFREVKGLKVVNW